jgi:hypothetical protein
VARAAATPRRWRSPRSRGRTSCTPKEYYEYQLVVSGAHRPACPSPTEIRKETHVLHCG